jgi:hypothetical protein
MPPLDPDVADLSPSDFALTPTTNGKDHLHAHATKDMVISFLVFAFTGSVTHVCGHDDRGAAAVAQPQRVCSAWLIQVTVGNHRSFSTVHVSEQIGKKRFHFVV